MLAFPLAVAPMVLGVGLAALDVGALLLARGIEHLAVIDSHQRVAFVRMFLDLHSNLDLGNEVFWGSWLFPFGALLYRSRFVPRPLGVWVILGGLAWLVDCFTGFLFPAYDSKAFLYGQVFMQGELVTMLWLMIVGAKERRLVTVISPLHFGTMLIGRSRRGKNGFRLRDEFFACDKAGRIRVDNRFTKLAQT